ncbi:DUF4243 domain-containing protein [Mitsuaria sp. TWR114]|nr:DUF4243 domain-containing protein [Mitsuaria sp. TWR114]
MAGGSARGAGPVGPFRPDVRHRGDAAVQPFADGAGRAGAARRAARGVAAADRPLGAAVAPRRGGRHARPDGGGGLAARAGRTRGAGLPCRDPAGLRAAVGACEGTGRGAADDGRIDVAARRAGALGPGQRAPARRDRRGARRSGDGHAGDAGQPDHDPHAARGGAAGFAAYVERPRLTLDDLAEASLAVYLARHQFAALHLVTGTHALRVLLAAAASRGLVVDEGQVLRSVWRAWLGTYLSDQRPAPAWALVHAGSASEDDWTRELPALQGSMNDHRIKVADAAREEWRHRGWPGYALCLRREGAAQ